MIRRGTIRLALGAALAAAWVSAVPAVSTPWAGDVPRGQEAPSAQQPQVTFRASVEAVTISASVRDRRGRIVPNLTKADFLVRESGVRRHILDVYVGDSPISLGVLLDISGSMSVGGNMDRARQAVGLAMKNLRSGSDEAALFTFDSSLQEVVAFTRDLDRVRQVSLEGKPWGSTTLFDAIAAAAESLGLRENRHRALLVITDGVDTGSRLTPPQVSAIASEIDVPVYLLTVLHPLDHSAGLRAALRVDGAATGIATLEDLSRWTGGQMRLSSSPSHTATALHDLFAELRHQYLITFEPGLRLGWHPLEIQTRHRDMTVRARSGYMARPS